MTQPGLLQHGQAEAPGTALAATRCGLSAADAHACPAGGRSGLRCGRQRSRRGGAGRRGPGRAPGAPRQPRSAPRAAAPVVPSRGAATAREPEHPRAPHTRERARTSTRPDARARTPPVRVPGPPAPQPQPPLLPQLGSGRRCGEGNSLLTGCSDPPGRGATPEAATAADPPRPPPPRSRRRRCRRESMAGSPSADVTARRAWAAAPRDHRLFCLRGGRRGFAVGVVGGSLGAGAGVRVSGIDVGGGARRRPARCVAPGVFGQPRGPGIPCSDVVLGRPVSLSRKPRSEGRRGAGAGRAGLCGLCTAGPEVIPCDRPPGRPVTFLWGRCPSRCCLTVRTALPARYFHI